MLGPPLAWTTPLPRGCKARHLWLTVWEHRVYSRPAVTITITTSSPSPSQQVPPLSSSPSAQRKARNPHSLGTHVCPHSTHCAMAPWRLLASVAASQPTQAAVTHTTDHVTCRTVCGEWGGHQSVTLELGDSLRDLVQSPRTAPLADRVSRCHPPHPTHSRVRTRCRLCASPLSLGPVGSPLYSVVFTVSHTQGEALGDPSSI